MVEQSAPKRPIDAEIARIATAQHGAITTAQLVGAGLSAAAVAKRAESGRLYRLHRGVYAVGHTTPSLELGWMAAVLACGGGAVLSHTDAAALWGLIKPLDGPIDVSAPVHSGRKRRHGIRIHRCVSLAGAMLPRGEEEPIPAITMRKGIPVTSPWRTVDDLRRIVSPQLYRRAVRQAELMRFALSTTTPRDRTRSDLERNFLRLCRHHGLPAPEVNVRIGPWTVDFLWRAERVVVETDSWATHGSSVAFEDDHERDLDLRRHGLSVHRFTEQQIRNQPRLVAGDLADDLARRRAQSAAELSTEANNRP